MRVGELAGADPWSMGALRARVGRVAADANPFAPPSGIRSPWGTVSVSSEWLSRAALPDAASAIQHDQHGDQTLLQAPAPSPGLPRPWVDRYGRPVEGYSGMHMPEWMSAALDVAASVAGMIPGVGTIVGPALATAAALGRGASVADAALAAVRAAVPGGALGQSAFDLAVGLARGEPPEKAVADAIRDQIPAAYRPAYDAGMAAAHGRPPSSRSREELLAAGVDAMT